MNLILLKNNNTLITISIYIMLILKDILHIYVGVNTKDGCVLLIWLLQLVIHNKIIINELYYVMIFIE